MRTSVRFTITALLALVTASAALSQEIVPYQDDPAILAILQKLDDNSSATLPAKKGRSSSDYSLRMAYVSDRQTAMYAGGNHNNGQMNDCWEYHLGSNTWHQLHPAEGGDHQFMKDVVEHRMNEAKGAARKDGKTIDTLEQYKQYLSAANAKLLDERIVSWWKENVVIRDGMVATRMGGPIMTSHTWDGIDYDPVHKRMVWVSGAGPHCDTAGFHAMVNGLPRAEVEAKMDKTYTPTWFFEPKAGKWLRYRKPAAGPCPQIRGFGQSLVWLPDRKVFLWYIAAYNVSPPSLQMWSWDPTRDVWQELKPNGGKSIADLVDRKSGCAPPEEQVIRYSPKQKKAYGFRGSAVYAYDVDKNEWSKVCADPRIAAHDAHTGIAYDSVNDVFIYTRKDAQKEQVKLAIFIPATNTWETPEIRGPALPDPQYAYLKCFFHPVHNVYVIATGTSPVWVYRYKKVASRQ